MALHRGRKAGVQQPEVEDKGLPNLGPRDYISSQAMRGLLLLTISSWDLGQFISTESVTD